MKKRKKCVLKALFRMGFRVFYYLDSDEFVGVCVFLTEDAESPFMMCHDSLIIEVPYGDKSDAGIDRQLGNDYASMEFIRSHQKEYDAIPEEYGYNPN